MGTRITLGVAIGLLGVFAVGRAIPPANPALPSNDRVTIDVVIDAVDFDANMISATSTIHVVPPHDAAGGQIQFTGTTGSRKEQATQYIRMPVMPAAKLAEKKPKAGLHAIPTLEILRTGCLAVVGIEVFTEPERIGVESLDAPGSKTGK